eukprot:82369-Rhodomonas_salina.3
MFPGTEITFFSRYPDIRVREFCVSGRLETGRLETKLVSNGFSKTELVSNRQTVKERSPRLSCIPVLAGNLSYFPEVRVTVAL